MKAPSRQVLLAEDSPLDAEMVLDVLSKHQLAGKVVHVRDGVEALDFLHRRGEFAGHGGGLPAVVLLDLKMPRMGGIEVLREIRGDPHIKYVPVVVMTSSSEEQDMTRCYQLGANGYVVKPLDFREFAEAVRLVAGFWALVNEPPPRALHLPQP